MPTILNPTPTEGTGTPFGKVPGALGLPDPFGDLSKVAPGLGGLNKNLLTNLTANSLGIVSPGTRNALQLTNAQTASGSGMPFSGLSDRALFGNIAGFTEGLQEKALQDYNSLIPTIKSTQTVSPELQTEIANRNAINAAAPSPRAAANYAKQLFDEYAAKVRGPGGGISFAPQPYTPKPLDFGNLGVGGGGVGVGAGGPTAPTVANNGLFNVTGNTIGGGPASLGTGGGFTYMGPNPQATDWTTSDPWGVGGFPGGGTPAAGAGPYNPLADASYNDPAKVFGPTANASDLFSSPAALDIFSELV